MTVEMRPIFGTRSSAGVWPMVKTAECLRYENPNESASLHNLLLPKIDNDSKIVSAI
jgi:hypothetical protein